MSNLFSDPLGSTDSFGGAAGVELAPIGVSVPTATRAATPSVQQRHLGLEPRPPPRT